MSLNIITSKTLQTGFENMLLKLKEKHLSEHNVIIVPDKFSLNAEQLMFDILNIDVSFNIEILSFTKLANIVLEKELKEKKIINKQISMLILSDVINSNKEKLIYFKNVNLIDGFCEDIFNLISQMQTSDFEIENFKEFDEIDKFRDIKLIYEKYLEALKNEKVDASKKFELLIEKAKESDFIKNSNFFFGMFYTLTPQMLKMTKEIMKQAKNSYFSCINYEGLNKKIYFDDVFKKVLRISKNISKDVVVENFNENLLPEFSHLLTRFGVRCRTQFNLENDSIKLIEAKDVESEVRACFSEIKFDMITKNLRLKDIAICCTNIEEYSPIIKKQQKLFNFDCFIDEEQKLDKIALIKFILNLSDVVENESLNNVLTILKSEFVIISENEKNGFEEYVLKYNISEKNIFSKIEFKKDVNFENYNFVFENFITPLHNFIKTQKLAQNSHEYFVNFNNFLNFLNIEETIKILTIKFAKQKNLLKSKQYSQLLTKIFEIFNNLEEYLENNFTIKRVNFFLKLLFSTSAVLTPPISIDSIFVGDLYNSYFHRFKNVYFLGCSNLNMPKSNTENSLVFEEENREYKLNLEPNILDVNRLNKFKCFINLFNATDKIYLSYPKKNNSNLNFKSSFIEEIQKLFTKFDEPLKLNQEEFETVEFLKPNNVVDLLGLYCNNIPMLESEFLKAEGEYREVLRQVLKHLNYKEKETKDEDFSGFKIDKLSVSKLEDYFSCPRKFMLKHILNLKPKESLKLDLKTIGNIIHEAIKEFSLKLGEICENSVLKTASEIFNKILGDEKYEFLKTQPENKILLETLKLEFVKFCANFSKQQQNSNFKNALNEFYFKKQIGSYNFNGIADRIDVFEDSFIVVDYKTGSTKFSYSEIFTGKKIQLVLYALFLEETLNKKCAGIFYLNLNDNFKKDKKVQNKMQGIVINQNNNLFRLDNSISENKGNFVSDYFDFSKKYQINVKEFDNLKNYCLNLIEEAIKDIENYKFFETPLKLSSSVGEICDYCDYKTICMNKKFKVRNSKNSENEMIRIMKDE